MFDNLSVADLDRMSRHAFREAARCWAEYRREPVSSPIRDILRDAAESADAFWRDVHDAHMGAYVTANAA